MHECTGSCRGLRTALVEREDFGSGTSSRSTKLVHGGVRYLEKAVFNLDHSQLKLVFEALKERRIMLDNAPHLSSKLPIMTVCPASPLSISPARTWCGTCVACIKHVARSAAGGACVPPGPQSPISPRSGTSMHLTTLRRAACSQGTGSGGSLTSTGRSLLQSDMIAGVCVLLTAPRGAVLQPCYSWFEVPYYWAGLKAYDLVANFSNLCASSYLSASESLRRFPTLAATRSDGQSLKGTVRSQPPPFLPFNPCTR